MFKSEYENDGEIWEATVAKAYAIVERAITLKRGYTSAERRKVESLMLEAETFLGLIGVPREPGALMAYFKLEAAKRRPRTPLAPS